MAKVEHEKEQIIQKKNDLDMNSSYDWELIKSLSKENKFHTCISQLEGRGR